MGGAHNENSFRTVDEGVEKRKGAEGSIELNKQNEHDE
jgi:hypothetical protein